MTGAPSTGAPGLVAVVAAKGGCGATLVATSLAVAAAGAPDRAVCLADLDFSRGDVARALDLADQDGLEALVRHLGRWDAELLRGALPEHASGVRALLQPYDLSALLRLDRGEAEDLLEGLRRSFPVVVADCGTQLDVPTLTALGEADRVVLVARGTLPAVRDAQRLLALLDRLGVGPERVALVLNAHRPGDLDPRQVERLLEAELAALLPHEPTCAAAELAGRLPSEVAPRSPLARAIGQLAAHLGLLPPSRTERAGTRLFGWGRP